MLCIQPGQQQSNTTQETVLQTVGIRGIEICMNKHGNYVPLCLLVRILRLGVGERELSYPDQSKKRIKSIVQYFKGYANPRWIPLYVTVLFLLVFLAVVVALIAGATVIDFGLDSQISFAMVYDLIFCWE